MGKYKVTSCVINSNLDEMHVPHYEATVKIELSDLYSAGCLSIDPIEIKNAIERVTPYSELGRLNISSDGLTVNYPYITVVGRRNGKTHTLEKIIEDGFEKLAKMYRISDVIFNDPATIVIWEDGSKTVVKAENEAFDPEKGLAMAISKKMLGNKYDYYEVFKKYVGRYEKKHKKGNG
ncbi:MAG: hypothetical protein J6Y02_21545 [Pseudobutyrivibrio sp.]|nr:hypothetical protein [Pseudobutyrivibrio sp.]